MVDGRPLHADVCFRHQVHQVLQLKACTLLNVTPSTIVLYCNGLKHILSALHGQAVIETSRSKIVQLHCAELYMVAVLLTWH